MLPLALIAGFFAALFLLVAAKQWWRVAHPIVEVPEVNVSSLRLAASATVIAFLLLGIALIIVFIDHVA